MSKPRKKRSKIIAVDFDGTLCKNKWPEIGDPNWLLITYLKARQKDGDKLILWTCRMDDRLTKAVKWCEEQGLIFDAVNENLPHIIKKFGGDSRKIFADEYLDDKGKHFIFAYEESIKIMRVPKTKGDEK